MKAIINNSITVPFFQVEEGYIDYSLINGKINFGYTVMLRCPYSKNLFEKLKELEINKIIILNIEYFNDMEESIGNYTGQLLAKEVFRVVNNNSNTIVIRLYPAEDFNE